jgi:hypothetical protein
LASTTVAGASVGQTLINVVANTALGGLTVSNTAGFSTQGALNYLLLSQSATPFALVSYVSDTTSSFTTLALPAGNENQVLESSTSVSQAPSGVTPAGAGQPLSASPFTFKMAGQPDTFTANGYLYVQASNGNYIIQYTSESDTIDGDSTFSGCTIVGAFGALTGNPFADTVNAGAFVVQSVAPSQGQSTSINSSNITVTANTPFTLPVVSTAGFAPATPMNPGYTLLYYQGGVLAVVSYTGISPDSNGGSDLTGCTTQTAGTIGAFGADSPGPAANVQWTSAAPITFTFTNNTAQDPVYIAIAGQQIDTQNDNASTYGYLAPQMTSGQPDFTKPWQFETFGQNTSVPTYVLFSDETLAGAMQNVLIPNDPRARLDSIRMIFSVGSAPIIPIVSGKPSFPAGGNPSDPNNDINYDFVEFTERSSPNDGILFINTTQVDQVGLPMTMQTTPTDAVKSNGVGITVSRPTLFSDFATYISQQFTANSKEAQAALAAFQSLAITNRLLNPSDAISNPPSPATASTFNSYFDPALTSFFDDYITAGQTFLLQRDGYYFVGQTVQNYSPPSYGAQATNTGTELLIPPSGGSPTSLTFAQGEQVTGPGITGLTTITGISVDASQVTHIQYAPTGTSNSGNYTFTVPGSFTVLQLSQSDSGWNLIPGGQQYQIYAPYFSNGSAYPANFPHSSSLAAAPPWITPTSAGEMVFGNSGAFAHGAAQSADGQSSGTGATGQILLDIENTIVSAFNRGVANSVTPGDDVTNAWNNNTTYYPSPNASGSNWSNFYAGFLHNDGVSITAPGSAVGLAYGFAYDDQGGNDPTLTSFATAVSITLNDLVAAPKSLPKLQFVVQPRVIKSGGRAELLVLGLKGAIPLTNYTVIVLKSSKVGYEEVGSPVTIKSNRLGGIRTSLKLHIRLRPGRYRILVQDLQDTHSAAISNGFRVT